VTAAAPDARDHRDSGGGGVERDLACLVRQVDEPPAACARQQEAIRQRRQPGTIGGLAAPIGGQLGDRLDEPAKVRRSGHGLRRRGVIAESFEGCRYGVDSATRWRGVDPTGLELAKVAGADSQEAASGRTATDVDRRGAVDDVTRVLLARRTQADPQAGVGPDVVGHDALGSLGGKQQVDAERPAALGDPNQPGDDVRLGLGECRELVDHDDQPSQRRCVERRVRRDVRHPRTGEHRLAASELGTERLQGAPGPVRPQVGEDSDDVRQ
jgi:hypothetical protein